MTFTEDGDVQLNNGKVIKDGDTSNLSRTEMLELYDTPASMFEILSIKKGQVELGESIQHVINKLDNKKAHHISNCPANQEAIEEIVEDKLGSVIKDKVLNTASIMKALSVIGGFFGGLGLIVYFILKALKVKIGV